MLSRDGVAGLVCLVLGAGMFAMTWGLPRPALVPIGPEFYPRIVLALLALGGAALLVRDLFGRAARRQMAEATPRPAGHRPAYGLVASAFAVIAGYIALMPMLGFRVASVLFVAALQLLLERPRTATGWLSLVAVALATGLLTHLVFERWLTVLLPRGSLTGV